MFILFKILKYFSFILISEICICLISTHLIYFKISEILLFLYVNFITVNVKLS
jgi:hypothetical protein